MATKVPTFKAGELLTAQKLNEALQAVANDAVDAALERLNNDEIRINGTWYKRSGVMNFPSGQSFTSAGGGVYHLNVSIPRPYSPPDGWEFEYFIMKTSAVTFAQKSGSNSSKDEIRVIQIGWDWGGAPSKLGWRLIKSS